MGGNTGEIQLGSERELYKYINIYIMPLGKPIILHGDLSKPIIFHEDLSKPIIFHEDLSCLSSLQIVRPPSSCFD